jgi:hypothetical protein
VRSFATAPSFCYRFRYANEPVAPDRFNPRQKKSALGSPSRGDYASPPARHTIWHEKKKRCFSRGERPALLDTCSGLPPGRVRCGFVLIACNALLSIPNREKAGASLAFKKPSAMRRQASLTKLVACTSLHPGLASVSGYNSRLQA